MPRFHNIKIVLSTVLPTMEMMTEFLKLTREKLAALYLCIPPPSTKHIRPVID